MMVELPGCLNVEEEDEEEVVVEVECEEDGERSGNKYS
jgi:hypothetical protein